MRFFLKYYFFFFLMIYFFPNHSIFAQKYNFKNFSVGNGLAQSQVYAICEDRRGLLWFGTLGGGLSMYDGYSFTTYMEEAGLKNNYIHSILEDMDGNLWIGTEEGIVIYNGKTFNDFDINNGPGNSIIKAIFQDKDGNIWVGTKENGLFRYNGKSFTHFGKPDGFNNNVVHCIFEDKEANIWIGTNNGAYKYSKDTFECYKKKDGLATNVVRSINNDNYGNIWFATYGGGVSCLKEGKFINYTVKEGLCNNTVFTILNDNEGNLWFGTAIGVSRFDGKSFKTFNEKSGLASNVVVYIIKDSSGNIWFGTSGGGVSKLDGERFIHYTENKDLGKWIYTLIQDYEGNMLFGSSSGGITIYNGKKFKLIKNSQGFTAAKVKSSYIDRDSLIWFGTLGKGAYYYDGKKYKKLVPDKGRCGNFISSISSDTAGNIWFATLDAGVGLYNKTTNQYIRIDVKEGLSTNRIYVISTDSSGNMWAGTEGSGVCKLVPPFTDSIPIKIINYTKKNGLNSNSIRAIVCDTSGNVYLGTAGGGINIYTDKGFISVSKKNGLSSNNIYSLIFDNNYNLWVGTEQGIDRITFNDNFQVIKTKHFGKSEGFTGIENCRNSICKDTLGNIWFGTVNGATKYNEQYDKINLKPPKTHITGIKLFFDRIENTEYSDSLYPWYSIPYELNLPHNKNHLSFEFIGISHSNPEAIKYQWKLEGFDMEWSPVLAQRLATYSNLPPGKYIFKVKSGNEDDIWNSEPASFVFYIQNPFWQEWWFRSIVFLFIVLIIFIAFLTIYRRVKRHNREVRKRLEMEKSILELEREAARLQMNPHFIFNTLNSIQGFIAQDDPFLAKRYLAKFARLMRLTLENAREEYIPLENEVEILKNYLDLEKLSTNDKFDYEIDIQDTVDLEMTEIPPMMIQPFVENAIIHGLKNKVGKGNIKVSFSILNNSLICEIIDDGIGRKKAAELKLVSVSKHKSTAMSVTKARLKQIEEQTNSSAGIEITDLYDENNISSGTKVIIIIPYEQ